MLKSVNCMNRWTAIDLRPRPDAAMISMLDESGYSDFNLPGWQHILYLKFRDLHQKSAETTRLGYKYFDRELAKQIVDFVDRLHKSPDEFHLLTHCEAGVSRSSAVAYWAAKTYNLELPAGFERRTGPNKLVLKELFSLSLGSDINIIERLVPLSCDNPEEDQWLFGAPSYYSEFDISFT